MVASIVVRMRSINQTQCIGGGVVANTIRSCPVFQLPRILCSIFGGGHHDGTIGIWRGCESTRIGQLHRLVCEGIHLVTIVPVTHKGPHIVGKVFCRRFIVSQDCGCSVCANPCTFCIRLCFTIVIVFLREQQLHRHPLRVAQRAGELEGAVGLQGSIYFIRTVSHYRSGTARRNRNVHVGGNIIAIGEP